MADKPLAVEDEVRVYARHVEADLVDLLRLKLAFLLLLGLKLNKPGLEERPDAFAQELLRPDHKLIQLAPRSADA